MGEVVYDLISRKSICRLICFREVRTEDVESYRNLEEDCMAIQQLSTKRTITYRMPSQQLPDHSGYGKIRLEKSEL